MRRQALQLTVVVTLRHCVVGGQPDIAIVGMRAKVGDITTVELGKVLRGSLSIAYLVEQTDEMLVALAIDMLQLDGDVIELLQRLAAEEEGGVVVATE